MMKSITVCVSSKWSYGLADAQQVKILPVRQEMQEI